MESSPHGINLTYNKPDDFLHDAVRGIIPPSAYSMEQWMQAVAFSVLNGGVGSLNMRIMINGNVYRVSHQVESVSYSEHVNNIQGAVH